MYKPSVINGNDSSSVRFPSSKKNAKRGKERTIEYIVFLSVFIFRILLSINRENVILII